MKVTEIKDKTVVTEAQQGETIEQNASGAGPDSSSQDPGNALSNSSVERDLEKSTEMVTPSNIIRKRKKITRQVHQPHWWSDSYKRLSPEKLTRLKQDMMKCVNMIFIQKKKTRGAGICQSAFSRFKDMVEKKHDIKQVKKLTKEKKTFEFDKGSVLSFLSYIIVNQLYNKKYSEVVNVDSRLTMLVKKLDKLNLSEQISCEIIDSITEVYLNLKNKEPSFDATQRIKELEERLQGYETFFANKRRRVTAGSRKKSRHSTHLASSSNGVALKRVLPSSTAYERKSGNLIDLSGTVPDGALSQLTSRTPHHVKTWWDQALGKMSGTQSSQLLINLSIKTCLIELKVNKPSFLMGKAEQDFVRSVEKDNRDVSNKTILYGV